MTANIKYKSEGLDFVAGGNYDFILVLNILKNPQLLQAGAARELVNHGQKLRKSLGLNEVDEIIYFMYQFANIIARFLLKTWVLSKLEIPILQIGEKTKTSRVINHRKIQRDEEVFRHVLCWKFNW